MLTSMCWFEKAAIAPPHRRGDRQDDGDSASVMVDHRRCESAEFLPGETLTFSRHRENEHPSGPRLDRPIEETPDVVDIGRVILGERPIEAGNDAPQSDRTWILHGLVASSPSFALLERDASLTMETTRTNPDVRPAASLTGIGATPHPLRTGSPPAMTRVPFLDPQVFMFQENGQTAGP